MYDEIKSKHPNKGNKKHIGNVLRHNVWYRVFGDTTKEMCYCCNKRVIYRRPRGYQVGHIKPECYGGPTVLENLRPICADCNQRMGTNNMYRFMLDNDYRYDKLFDCEYAEGYDCGLSEEE